MINCFLEVGEIALVEGNEAVVAAGHHREHKGALVEQRVLVKDKIRFNIRLKMVTHIKFRLRTNHYYVKIIQL